MISQKDIDGVTQTLGESLVLRWRLNLVHECMLDRFALLKLEYGARAGVSMHAQTFSAGPHPLSVPR